jgi:O-antigen/teichoic acid export membrane protein
MILKNTFFQAVGQAVGKLLTFFLFIFIARSLSVESFGQFNFIYAYAAIFAIFMDFGMDILIPKLVAITPLKLKFLLPLIKFKLICVSLVFSIYVVITLGMRNNDSFTTYMLAGLGTALYSLISFLFGIYRGKESLKYEAVFTIMHKGLFFLLSVLSVYYGFFLKGIFGALVISSTIVLIFACCHVWKRYGYLISETNEIEIKKNKEIFKEALPYLFINVCTIIYFRIDTLMLSYLKSNYDVGIYNAAYRLMEGLIFIPGAFMTAFFPVLVRAANRGRSYLNDKFKEGLISISLIGLLISGPLMIGSYTFISLFWGQRYIEAVPILKLLAVALFIIHLNYIVTQSAIAQNKEKLYMVTVVCAVLINIGLNFPLINLYAARGAALSTIITELFLGLVLFISTVAKKNHLYQE